MNRVLSTSLVLLFFISSPFAEAKRRTVEDLLNNISKKDIKKEQTIIEASQAPEPKRIKRSQLRSLAPPKRMDSFFKPSDQDEKELGRLLDSEIKELFRLMRQYQKSANRGEIWLRLAERYMEKSKLLEYTIQENLTEI